MSVFWETNIEYILYIYIYMYEDDLQLGKLKETVMLGSLR